MSNGKLQKFKGHMQKQEQSDPTIGLVSEGATVQRVQTDFIQAIKVQVPRDLEALKDRVLKEAEMFPDGLIYAWTAGKAIVKGPTIKLAMMLVREWGNCDAQSYVIAEDNRNWIFMGEFIDIERGFRLRREYRKRKSEQVGGKYSDERKETMAFQSGQSKCIRNVVINAMPGGLVQKVMEIAEEGQRKDVERTEGGVQKQIGKIERAFQKYNVSIEQLEDKLDKKRKDWGSQEVTTLRALYRGLEEGHTTIEHEFAPESPIDEPSDGPPPGMDDEPPPPKEENE
jgi:hypothetical protein